MISRKRGRPKKEVDEGVIFHMLKNKAPVSAIAKHLGVNRDTLYVRYRDLLKAGREANMQAWGEIITPILEERARPRRLKRQEMEARAMRRHKRLMRCFHGHR